MALPFDPDLRLGEMLESLMADNACAESFWGRLKVEPSYRQHYRTRAEAKAAVFEIIEVFYNRTRRH
jgi:transposase InsO family protein